jgi:hypothetical protein
VRSEPNKPLPDADGGASEPILHSNAKVYSRTMIKSRSEG